LAVIGLPFAVGENVDVHVVEVVYVYVNVRVVVYVHVAGNAAGLF